MVCTTGKITLCTYNSTGLNQQRTDFIELLIAKRNPDFLLLQETWLLSSQLRKLSSLHPNYVAHGISGMDDRQHLISGRRYGGLAILWKKSLASSGACSMRIEAASTSAGESNGMLPISVR